MTTYSIFLKMCLPLLDNFLKENQNSQSERKLNVKMKHSTQRNKGNMYVTTH